MISFVEGKLLEKDVDSVVISAGGIGYLVAVPVSTAAGLPGAGKTVGLHTYLHVREDILQLYGFATRSERAVFGKLISVSGIGPRVALAVLSAMNAESLFLAVEQAQTSLLSKVPGIGKKTAERLVFELKGKLGDLVPLDVAGATGAAGPLGAEAVAALVSLGYSNAQADTAVRKALESTGGNAVETGELVRLALTEL